MQHARADYQRMQDPAGKIPDEEPVLLIRGQDLLAAAVLKFYADLAEKNGVDPTLVAVVRDQAIKMESWPVKKLPDLPRDMEAEVGRLNERMPNHELVISKPYGGGALEETRPPGDPRIQPVVAAGASPQPDPPGGLKPLVQGEELGDEPPDDVKGKLSPVPLDPSGREIEGIQVNDPNLFDKMMNRGKR